MEDLGVIKEENKTKKWISSKVGLSLILGEQKKKKKTRREEEEEEKKRKKKKRREKVWNLLSFVWILVWTYGFLWISLDFVWILVWKYEFFMD